MRSRGIYYCEPVFRPPSEAGSLLVHATVGCKYRCAFCVPYLHKKFRVRPVGEVVADLEEARRLYGAGVRRVFLLDGNAMAAPTDHLLEVTRATKRLFPKLERVSVYAHARDVLDKDGDELSALAREGLTLAYVGIETGDPEWLRRVGKATTPDEIVEAGHELHRAGITFSGTIILGITGWDAGLESSKRHAAATAEVVNRLNPAPPRKWYVAALSLMIPPGTRVARWVEAGKFRPLNATQVLLELLALLEGLDPSLKMCVFRANHASNYLPLKGTLARDLEALKERVRHAIAHPEVLKPEYFRGL
ncbi:MAG: radical SAM protein [Promethearchaeota archaeon]